MEKNPQTMSQKLGQGGPEQSSSMVPVVVAFLLGSSVSLVGLRWSQFGIPIPDQVTTPRVAAVVGLLALLVARPSMRLPNRARRLAALLTCLLVYATTTLLWTPNFASGSNVLVGIALALFTALLVVATVNGDSRAFRALIIGVLSGGLLQVSIAIWELVTDNHLASPTFGVASAESGVFLTSNGQVAWGTLGNPNDLGGFLLLVALLWINRSAATLGVHGLLRIGGYLLVAAIVLIGLTSLQDARAFRFGLLALLLMWGFDRLVPMGRGPTRRSLGLLIAMAMAAVTLVVLTSLTVDRFGPSDALRIQLIGRGLFEGLSNAGFGRGVGSASYLVESGELPTNLHNVFAQLSMEFGLPIAMAFSLLLVRWVLAWLLETQSGMAIGQDRARLRAGIAVTLAVYGATSSGVLESPVYWLGFATAVAIGHLPHKH